jgi:O-antigen ligase
MGIPLALGVLCAGISRGMRGVRPIWRERVLWLSSPDASRLVLVAGGIAVMALSLIMTLSRSGICALALALVITAGFWLSASTVGKRSLALGYLVLLVVCVIGWAGTDTIAGRFAQTDWHDLNGRLDPFHDTWRIAQAFPLAGSGLNTFETAMIFFEKYNRDGHLSQAHNDYLQAAAEGGLLILIPVVLCLGLFTRDVVRRFREDGDSSSYWYRAGAVAALVAIGLQETVDFSLQMPGNAALFAVVCGIALHTSPVRTAPARHSLRRRAAVN